jgi:hypothetical protein
VDAAVSHRDLESEGVVTALDRTATQLAQEVAKHLPGWVARGDDEASGYVASIVRSTDGASVKVYLDTDGKRAELMAGWPRYADGSGYHPPEYLKITVSASRSGDAVAGEIERRLLGKYLPMYATALSEVHDGDLRAKAAEACRGRLAKLLDGQVRGDSIIGHNLTDVHEVRVNASRAPSVHIKLYGIDELTATRILTILKQREEAKGEPPKDAPDGAASATDDSGEEVVG